jgi:tape measure domain-containing protein
MNSALTFILKIQDMLTPGMRAAVSASKAGGAQIESQFAKVYDSSKKMGASVNELKERLDSLNSVRFATRIVSEFENATREARKLEKEIDKLENKGKSRGGLGSMLTGLAGGYGVFQMGKSALTGAATREQQQISFGVMTGSKANGDKMVNDLVNMGAKTPYESKDLIKNAQTLKAFGIENEKVLPILQTIGDVAAGDANKLASLSLAFAQVSSAGKLSGQDLLQMVNAGFNPLQQMVTDKVFPSMAAARKAMEHGAIGAGMMEAAFRSATGPGGQFHQMMEKQSTTLNGRWSTFMDNVNEKLLRLGQHLMPAAGWLLDFGSAMMDGQPWAIGLAAAIGLLTLSLTWTSIQTGWASLQLTLYSAAARSAAFFTGIWNGIQSLLNATFWANPITWVIASIIALIAIIGYVIYTTDGWGKQWDSLIQFFKHSWAAFKEYFNFTWLNIVDGFMSGIELMLKGWYKLKSLWDEDGAAAGLAKINEQQNTRAAEIAKSKGVMETELKAAQDALKWELKSNGKGMDDITAGIKKKLGFGGGAVTPVSANVQAGADPGYGKMGGLGDGTGAAKGKVDAVNGGGQRSIVINITKVIETIENHLVGGSREVADEIEAAVRESMRRVFNSMNGTAV